MQLFPTRPTVHLALASLGVVTAGVILRSPAVFGWAGRFARRSGARRGLGADDSCCAREAPASRWCGAAESKRARAARGAAVSVEIELRNRRIASPVGFAASAPSHSSELEVVVEPTEHDTSARSSADRRGESTPLASVVLPSRARLEVRGAPGVRSSPGVREPPRDRGVPSAIAHRGGVGPRGALAPPSRRGGPRQSAGRGERNLRAARARPR